MEMKCSKEMVVCVCVCVCVWLQRSRVFYDVAARECKFAHRVGA